MQKFNSVNELVNTIQPVDPIYCIRPDSIKLACSWFQDNFPGKVLYAVKTNPNEEVIKYISERGIDRFDVASINEIKLIKKLFPDSQAYYMNTIKSRKHIQEAYFNYNIRDFAFDTKEELQKIIDATGNARDLILYAVKTNPNEKVIRNIVESGIDRFDVASINEIKLIKKYFLKLILII